MSWERQLKEKWEGFWDHDNNLNLLKVALNEILPSSSFIARIKDDINDKCTFPRDYVSKSMTCDEVQRQVFFIVEMTSDLKKQIMLNNESCKQSRNTGVVGRLKELRM